MAVTQGLTAAIKKLGRPMTYYPGLARLVGFKESIFLCQLVYWTPRCAASEKGLGWIFKSVEEMEEETALGYKEQIRIRKSLVEQGLINEDYDRETHRLYFKVAVEKLDSLAEHLPDGHMPKGKVAHDQQGDGTCPKVSSHLPKGQIDKGSRDYTEITTEITQGEATAAIPPDLHPLNYGEMLLTVLELPLNFANKTAAADTIQAEITAGKSPPSAYEFVLAGCLDARHEGWPINKFFLQDAKHRFENRKANPSGKQSVATSTAGTGNTARDKQLRSIASLRHAATQHASRGDARNPGER